MTEWTPKRVFAFAIETPEAIAAPLGIAGLGMFTLGYHTNLGLVLGGAGLLWFALAPSLTAPDHWRKPPEAESDTEAEPTAEPVETLTEDEAIAKMERRLEARANTELVRGVDYTVHRTDVGPELHLTEAGREQMNADQSGSGADDDEKSGILETLIDMFSSDGDKQSESADDGGSLLGGSLDATPDEGGTGLGLGLEGGLEPEGDPSPGETKTTSESGIDFGGDLEDDL